MLDARRVPSAERRAADHNSALFRSISVPACYDRCGMPAVRPSAGKPDPVSLEGGAPARLQSGQRGARRRERGEARGGRAGANAVSPEDASQSASMKSSVAPKVVWRSRGDDGGDSSALSRTARCAAPPPAPRGPRASAAPPCRSRLATGRLGARAAGLRRGRGACPSAARATAGEPSQPCE